MSPYGLSRSVYFVSGFSMPPVSIASNPTAIAVSLYPLATAEWAVNRAVAPVAQMLLTFTIGTPVRPVLYRTI
jgi:hypothetical protein